MPGVMDTRREFVDQNRSVVRKKKFDTKTADAIHGLNGSNRNFPHARGLFFRVRRWRFNDMADVFVLNCFHDRIDCRDRPAFG